MDIETFLAIASFAISVGGLILALSVDQRRKKVVLVVVVIVLLLAMSGATVYQHYQHNLLINRQEKEIIEKLNGNTWTFERLYQELFSPSFPVVNEALFRAVEKRVVRNRIIDVRVTDDGTMQPVRVYFLESP